MVRRRAILNTEEAYELLQKALEEMRDSKTKEECSMAIEELYEKASMYDDLTF